MCLENVYLPPLTWQLFVGEVECPIQQQQQYRYMASEAGTLQRARPLAADHTVADGHLWPSNNDKKVATIERQPVDIG